MWYAVLIAALTAYLLGNLNGAVCVSALIANDDVRKHGSGNAGLTNFIRNYGTANALFVILIDGGKAALACLAASAILASVGHPQEGLALGGLMVMVGHAFPALLGFRGGKGILSGFFVALTIDWRIALIILAVFAIAYGFTQFVSLGSVLASAAFAICFGLFHNDNIYVMCCGIAMGILALFMHRSNILRLLKGQERKTNLFKKADNK